MIAFPIPLNFQRFYILPQGHGFWEHIKKKGVTEGKGAAVGEGEEQCKWALLDKYILLNNTAT